MEYLRTLIIPVAIILVLLMGFYLVMVRPFKAKDLQLTRELEGKLQSLKRYQSSPQGPPSKEMVIALQEGNALLLERYNRLRESLGAEFLEIPEINKPLEYLQYLGEWRKEVSSLAAEAQMSIPKSFGFPNALPQEEEIPQLTWRMAFIKKIIAEMARARINSFDAFSLTERKKHTLYEKINYKVGVKGDVFSIVKFLNILQNAPNPAIINSLHITSTPKGKLKLFLDLNRVVWS